MRTTSLKLDVSHLTANDEAVLRCRKALELRDKGDYDGARDITRPFWQGIGRRPETAGLHTSVTAEVLLTVGILTGWIGSRNEIKEADTWARDLITEAITFYESVGDLKKVAEARTELAYCYWRAGALDEARIMFCEALSKLTTAGNTRANALLGLSVVEWSSSRHDEAHKLLTDNAELFRRIPNHALKGFYHNQLAMVLRSLGTEGKKADYYQQAINEYEKADREFRLAHNTVFRAHVKNNVGFLLYKLRRFRKAHEYLGQARSLTVRVRDRVRTAQVDETRAQAFIAERRFREGEGAARTAASSFEKAGRQCFLAEALTTQGVALAQLGRIQRARFVLQKAIEVSYQAGALNIAGIAVLTLIEEIDNLPLDVLLTAYDNASEWLADCQSAGLSQRLNRAAQTVIARLRSEEKSEKAAEGLFNKGCYLPEEILKFEHGLIRAALVQANGSITSAAKLLGIGYQRLAYTIGTRHKDLLKERTPIHRRSRKGKIESGV